MLAHFSLPFQSLRRAVPTALLAGTLALPTFGLAAGPTRTPPGASTGMPSFYACLDEAWFTAVFGAPVLPTNAITVYSDCLQDGTPDPVSAASAPCKTLVQQVNPSTPLPPVFQRLATDPAEPAAAPVPPPAAVPHPAPTSSQAPLPPTPPSPSAALPASVTPAATVR